jgi:hypothetical protein
MSGIALRTNVLSSLEMLFEAFFGRAMFRMRDHGLTPGL